jgi:hypothetical protein
MSQSEDHQMQGTSDSIQARISFTSQYRSGNCFLVPSEGRRRMVRVLPRDPVTSRGSPINDNAAKHCSLNFLIDLLENGLAKDCLLTQRQLFVYFPLDHSTPSQPSTPPHHVCSFLPYPHLGAQRSTSGILYSAYYHLPPPPLLGHARSTSNPLPHSRAIPQPISKPRVSK